MEKKESFGMVLHFHEHEHWEHHFGWNGRESRKLEMCSPCMSKWKTILLKLEFCPPSCISHNNHIPKQETEKWLNFSLLFWSHHQKNVIIFWTSFWRCKSRHLAFNDSTSWWWDESIFLYIISRQFGENEGFERIKNQNGLYSNCNSVSPHLRTLKGRWS